ncbi:hypothetical protein R6Z07F_009307 [Ovis aries]
MKREDERVLQRCPGTPLLPQEETVGVGRVEEARQAAASLTAELRSLGLWARASGDTAPSPGTLPAALKDCPDLSADLLGLTLGHRKGNGAPWQASCCVPSLAARYRRRNKDLGPEAAGLSGPIVSPVKWVDVPAEPEDRPGQRRPGPALLPARARALVSASLRLFLPLLTVLTCMAGYSLRRSWSLKFKTNRPHCVRSGHAGSQFHHPRPLRS